MYHIFTNQQIKEFRNHFQLYQEKDDVIETKYLATILLSINHNLSPEELNNYIQKYDRKGYIHFDDFLLILEDRFIIEPKNELLEAFRIFDPNNTGYIGKNKLIEILTTMGEKLDKNEINDLLSIAIIDENDNIDYKDLVENILNF